MRPFTQGSIDTFCAVYAILNALQITHGLKGLDARTLYNNLLLTISKDEAIFIRILTLKTDYQALVDVFLKMCSKDMPVKVQVPFKDMRPKNEEEAEKMKKDFWEILEDYLAPDNNRTAIFQFEKRLALSSNPIFSHWTTAWQVEDKELKLFDCSPEAHAIKSLVKEKSLFLKTLEFSGEYYLINPYTLRLIEKE